MTVLQTLMKRYADAGDQRALILLSPQLVAEADRQFYVRLRTLQSIADAKGMKAKTIQIGLGQANGCSLCRHRNGEVLPIDTPVESLILEGCERHASPHRALCDVTISGWIKRPGCKPCVER